MRYLFVVLLLAFLESCAVAPTYEIQNPELLASDGSVFDGQATVYVFRGPEAPTRPINISIDGVVQGAIKRQTYVQFASIEGSHLLLASPLMAGEEPSVTIRASLRGGKTYYFVLNTKFELQSGGTSELTSTLRQMDAAAATKMLSTYRQQAPPNSK